jgi:hypothetical protein
VFQESGSFLGRLFDQFLKPFNFYLQLDVLSMNRLLFLHRFLVLYDLALEVLKLIFRLNHQVLQRLIFLLHVDQRLHQKLFVAPDIAVSTQVRFLSLVLLFLQQGDDFVELAHLLFCAEDFMFIVGPDLGEVNLLNFILLFLAELLEEASLAFDLVDDLLIFLDLILVLLNVFLNPKGEPTARWTPFLFLRDSLVMVEVRRMDEIAFVVVLSLDAGSVHLNGWLC